MSILEAILLGLIQGLTEFLPVSSSGHLVIAQALLPNFTSPGMMFDLWLHLGTLGAVIIYFRKDIKDLLTNLFPQKTSDSSQINKQRKLLGLIILGCLPTALIGFGFKHPLEAMFESAQAAAVMLLITGLLLWLADRATYAKRPLEQMGVLDAIIIGTVQGIAIIPGISRSGSTIATGIYRRLNRDLAARYSFLLSIPAIIGAALLEIKEWGQLWESINPLPLMLGGLCALITGYLAINLLMKLVVKQKLSYFAYYCWAVGIVSIIALWV
jgi:undecaprenyl-diphosphatase